MLDSLAKSFIVGAHVFISVYLLIGMVLEISDIHTNNKEISILYFVFFIVFSIAVGQTLSVIKDYWNNELG